ncbi:MAG TPA: hypothetical protein VG652_05515 [Gaiellaceae bacterium]|nr:hypothetical protein [Gaiellaceae bacterium]
MSSRAVAIALACLLAAIAAGCGSSAKRATTTTRPLSASSRLRSCLQKDGYAASPETAADVRTAPRRFEFDAVWNVINPTRVALALTFSRNVIGAERAAAWTRRTNAKLAKGALSAPVVRIGKIDVLWTSKPGARNRNDVYGCIRQSA